MISLHRDRRIVPRWRPIKPRNSFLEEIPIRSGVQLPLDQKGQLELEDALSRWKLKKTLPVALELLNSTDYLQGSEEIKEASRIVLLSQSASRIARTIAEGAHSSAPVVSNLYSRSVPAIAVARAQLLRDPRNAFAALNLAHAYCAIGLVDKAGRFILQALAAAGTNRTVLRSASRYYLHVDEQEKAHHLLARAPTLLHDPWLLSGELALADVIGRTSVNVKSAKSMADSESISAIHRSELNAAIGDLQMNRGDHKRARKNYLIALASPTENVVAQAQFLETRGEFSLPVLDAMTRLKEAPEARAMAALMKSEWGTAQEQARRWLEFEPFSTRPANLGFTAADVGSQDMEEAAFFAGHGVRANPGNTMQHNNLAFALAQLGRTSEAKEAFLPCATAIARGLGEPSDRHVYKATAGLIAWRTHDPEGGRRGYQEAANYFEKNNETQRLADCLARWAAEELNAGHEAEAPKLIARAHEVAKAKERSLTHVLLDHIDSIIKKQLDKKIPPGAGASSVATLNRG